MSTCLALRDFGLQSKNLRPTAPLSIAQMLTCLFLPEGDEPIIWIDRVVIPAMQVARLVMASVHLEQDDALAVLKEQRVEFFFVDFYRRSIVFLQVLVYLKSNSY